YMVHQLSKIVGVELDRIGTARLVGGAVAATVVSQHGGFPGEPLGHWAPKLAVHGDGMDKDGSLLRVPVAVEGIGDPRSIAGRRQLDTHWKSPSNLDAYAEFSRIQRAPSKGSNLADERGNALAEGRRPERTGKVTRAPLRLADRLVKRGLDRIGR